MKRQIVVALGALLTAAPIVAQQDTAVFTVVKELPITSIKDQNNSGTCWCFSSLAFFESELLRMDKGEYDLCESYVVYRTMIDRAEKSVRMHGDVSFSQGGSFYDVVYCLQNYGICPQEAMVPQGSLYGDTLFDHSELDAVATAYVKAIAGGQHRKISSQWKKGLEGIYNNYVGELPSTFEVDGKTYTPQSYYESLGLNMDDYVSLTSYTHHPFYSKFVIEVQDNWRWAESYNLPLDEFMEVFDNAIFNGYPIAWGADVSEKGFNSRGGVARVPEDDGAAKLGSDAARWGGEGAAQTATRTAAPGEKTITQEMRQAGYDNWETTDDHGMLIYGIAKDSVGTEYYMVKNSWGDYGPYHGIFYVSKPYVAYKTMNILVHKDALPKSIRKKLGF